MTNTKVSDLTAASSATDDDLFYIVDGTSSKKITFNNLINSISDLHIQGTDTALDTGGSNEVTAAQAKTAYTHSQDNTQAHSDYLLNSEVDVGVGLTLTGDNSSSDTAYVPMVLYNTDATPPAANTVPVGTIYIQYTP